MDEQLRSAVYGVMDNYFRSVEWTWELDDKLYDDKEVYHELSRELTSAFWDQVGLELTDSTAGIHIDIADIVGDYLMETDRWIGHEPEPVEVEPPVMEVYPLVVVDDVVEAEPVALIPESTVIEVHGEVVEAHIIIPNVVMVVEFIETIFDGFYVFHGLDPPPPQGSMLVL